MNRIVALYLALIVILGLTVRLFQLSTIPNGFHDDELDAGYIGRFILLHGEDIKGNPWPLYFNKLGDFRPTGIYYLSGLSTFVFGINIVAVRFPGVLFGALTIIPVYSLTTEIFKKRKIGLIAALFLSILPWHVVLARATSEAVIGLFFFLTGLCCLLKGLRNKQRKLTLLSFIFLLLSYLFYPSFRLLVPLSILPLIFIPKLEINSRRITIFLGSFFLLLTIIIAATSWGGGRLSQVAFYKNPLLPNTIDTLIFADVPSGSTGMFITRVIHNKGVIYGREFIGQFAAYFSPAFLFVQGGLPLRYAVPQQGLLFIFLGPLSIIGLLWLLRNREEIYSRLYLLFLIILSPLPAALTYEDSPNLHRALLLMIPIIILASYGCITLIKYLSRRRIIMLSLIILVTGIFSWESMYFIHQYFIHSPSYKSVLRKEGNREIASVLISQENAYSQILMARTDDIALYYLFFSHKFDLIPAGVVGEYNRITTLENIHFTDDECPSQQLTPDEIRGKNLLIIDQGQCPINGRDYRLLDISKRHDGTVAFHLLTPA